MAVNFNQNSAWNLKPISVDAVREEVNGLLIDGEKWKWRSKPFAIN